MLKKIKFLKIFSYMSRNKVFKLQFICYFGHSLMSQYSKQKFSRNFFCQKEEKICKCLKKCKSRIEQNAISSKEVKIIFPPSVYPVNLITGFLVDCMYKFNKSKIESSPKIMSSRMTNCPHLVGTNGKQNKNNLMMFQVFEQAKKLCKIENQQSREASEMKLSKLKKILSEITYLLNQPYTNVCKQFVGALCIFVYISRSSKNLQKIESKLKKQFYQNLPDVLADAYSHYAIKKEGLARDDKGTTLSTFLRILLEIHDKSPRLKKKIFTQKMIDFLTQIGPLNQEDMLRQSVKLKINAIFFSNFRQRLSLGNSLFNTFESTCCNGPITEKIIQTVQNITCLEQFPKEQLAKLIRFLRHRILNLGSQQHQMRPICWIYAKYAHLCEGERFKQGDLEDLFQKFRKTSGLQKNVLKSIIENMVFRQPLHHLKLVKTFVQTSGVENQIYTKLLIRNFPNFDSATIIEMLSTDFLHKLDYILFQKHNSKQDKHLIVELFQQAMEMGGKVNQALGWMLEKRLSFHNLQQKSQQTSNPSLITYSLQ